MILLDDFSQLQLHGGMAACSYTSWWFLTTSTSMEAIFQSSRNFQSYTLPYNHHANFESCTLPIISLTSNPPLLVTKTSQNFQSYTLPILSQSHKNFLRKLLTKTSNPPLLVTQSYENFLQKLLKTSYENFSKLPILHSSNPLAILRKLLTKTSNSSTFGYENSSRKLPIPPLLVMKTSNSSTFGYENLKLPILSQTSDSLNLKTWKTLPSSYNFQSSPTWTFL